MDGARRTLLMITGALLAIGIVMVYSASFVAAERKLGSATHFLVRQSIYMVIGCLALAITSTWDYHRLTRHWRWFIAIAVVMLGLVLVPGIGHKFNGARRWFSIGGLTFQPSEAAKPLMILGIAGWVVYAREHLGSFWRGFLPAVILAGLPVGLIALEPDLGSAGLLAIVLCAILFTAGISLKYAIPTVLCALPLAVFFAYNKLGYIRSRIEVFLNGSGDPLGAGYHIHQAMIAQGSGGLFGVGLGQGRSKLLYLPEAHNDFILALIGEELGLIGTLSIVALFAFFVIQGWRVARRAPDMLGTLIALGVTLCVGFQAAINIAVVTHSMPTKGISLPFISYGGSSLIFLLASVGLLLNVAAHPACDELPDTLGAVPKRKGSGGRSGTQPVPDGALPAAGE